MTFSSAYLYAKQITSVTPSQNNVVFDNGAFNANIMKSGFSWLNNSWVATWPGFNSDNMAIRGGGASGHINTSEILIATGDNAVDANITNNMICHTGESTDPDSCGRGYYLPLDMQSLQTEGYTKLKFTAGNSAYGIPGATETFEGTSEILLLKSNGSTGMSVLNNLTISEEGLSDNPPQITYEIDLTSYQEYVPTYLAILFYNGTTHISKIWFE